MSTRKSKVQIEESNPALYADLSVPFESADAVNEALRAFFLAVRKARIKYRIADVTVVAMAKVASQTPSQVITYHHNGAVSNTSLMLAWALGKAEREDHALLDQVRRQSAAGSST